jgi:hypothetical protein
MTDPTEYTSSQITRTDARVSMPAPARGWISRSSVCLSVCLAFVILLPACSQYSFERDAAERGTLGEELFSIWRKDAARAPRASEARVAMLDRRRQSFISAVDTAVPPDQVDQLDQFLRGSSFSIDQHHIQPVTKKLRLAMIDAADTPAIVQALDGRGYPVIGSYLSESPSLIAHVTRFNRLGDSLRTLLDPLATADGWTPAGNPAPEESVEFRGTQRALADAMTALSQPGSRDTVFRAAPVVLRGALTSEQQVFARQETPRLSAVRYDARGFPLAKRLPDGRLPYPLTDNNSDGMADVDARGQFLLQTETADTIEPFQPDSTGPVRRDQAGRAVTQDGRQVFQYVDLTRTGLFHGIGAISDWTAADIQWKLIDGLPALLGDRTQPSRRFPKGQPLVNVAHAALTTIDVDNIGGAAAGLGQFLYRETATIAEMADALSFAADVVQTTPDTQVKSNQTIDYDLVPLLEEISSDPQLWADVLEALDDPIVRRADDAFARMIRFKNRDITPQDGGPYDQCFKSCRSRGDSQWSSDEHPHGIGTVQRYECIRSCPMDEIFSERTDFDQPEGQNNRSTAQRLFHLLHDVSGTPYSMEITNPDVGPPVFELNNAAEAFIDSVAQEIHLRDVVNEEFSVPLLNLNPDTIADFASTLSTLTGVKLDKRPRPSQITRLFNQEDVSANILGFNVDISDPTCKDGYVMAKHHADILYASEASGLVDAIQPLAKAFGRHGRNDLFARFFVVLHDHYSKHTDLYLRKDGTPSPMKGSNLVSLEPALMEILRDGRLFGALTAAADTLNGMKPVEGTSVTEHLRRVVERATSPLDEPSFDGRTSVTMRDGDATDSPSPMHYLIKGVGEIADKAANHPDAESALGDAASMVASELFETIETDSGGVRLKHPGHLALIGLALEDVGDAAALLDDQTRHQQFTQAWPRALETGLASQNFADVTTLLDNIATNPDTRRALDGLIDHVFSTKRGRRITTAATYRLLVRSTRLATWQPIARHFADVLDPDRTWALSDAHQHHADTAFGSNLVELTRDMLSRDDQNYSQTLIRRALNQTVRGPDGTERSPIGVMTNTIGRYFRADPDATASFDADDHRQALRDIAEWLGSEDHGMERLYELIGLRAGSGITPSSSSE